jgi:hypothetical protein
MGYFESPLLDKLDILDIVQNLCKMSKSRSLRIDPSETQWTSDLHQCRSNIRRFKIPRYSPTYHETNRFPSARHTHIKKIHALPGFSFPTKFSHVQVRNLDAMPFRCLYCLLITSICMSYDASCWVASQDPLKPLCLRICPVCNDNNPSMY